MSHMTTNTNTRTHTVPQAWPLHLKDESESASPSSTHETWSHGQQLSVEHVSGSWSLFRPGTRKPAKGQYCAHTAKGSDLPMREISLWHRLFVSYQLEVARLSRNLSHTIIMRQHITHKNVTLRLAVVRGYKKNHRITEICAVSISNYNLNSSDFETTGFPSLAHI